jgi:cell wall-associated NlpC family hydrolase
MSLDGLAAIQSRIAQIQQRFGGAVRPSGATTVAGSGPASGDFAAVLAGAREGVATGTLAPPGAGAPGTSAGPAGARVRAFLDEALRQSGDPYVWGAHASPDDPDPKAFDCSELTRWAARRVGIDLPDGSWLQYLRLKEQGALVPLEQALRTPGALLFSFSDEPRPGGGRPTEAHVAISLGDGRTIEARGRKYGVGSFDAADRFQYGAVVPGL